MVEKRVAKPAAWIAPRMAAVFGTFRPNGPAWSEMTVGMHS